jgi:ubiquinone/menaquinone biosynthesis C-methylase UbiE
MTTSGNRSDARTHAQRAYYAATAEVYEHTHVGSFDEHTRAMRYAIALMRAHGVRTVLDVGTGTGRAVRGLREAGFHVTGIEPVRELLDAGRRRGLDGSGLIRGDGAALPFRAGSFDAVCEFGVLHHVKDPMPVVAEMLRVARKAVFLSDTNRFGRASLVTRVVKLALWKLRLWPLAYRVWTRGRGCDISDCDGVAYSYSVYDSLDRISHWADRVLLVPTKFEGQRLPGWAHPLLTSSHILLCGLKEFDDWPSM